MTKQKVLLIMPYHQNYAEYYWIPTNLIFLSTSLKAAGYSPFIIDDRVLDREKVLKALKDHLDDTLLVGIAASTGNQLKNALELARAVKQISASVPVVFGGPFSSALPELTLSAKEIDYVIVGRGEQSIVKLCDCLSHKNVHMDLIPNLFYEESGILKQNHPPSIKDRIDGMPELCYFDENIIDLTPYINPETRAINYSTGTGCVGRCAFCFWESSYHLSFFSPDRVVSQLCEFKKRLNIQNISFDDPTFFNNRKRTLKITELMQKNQLDVNWRGNGRIDTIKNYALDDFYQIKEAGCDVIHFGLEHGSQRILDLMNKKIDVKDTITILNHTKKAGIQSRFHLIMGNPTERIEDLKMTSELLYRLLEIDPELDYTINFFTPFPGNAMTEVAKKYGYIPPRNLEAYGDLDAYIYTCGKNMDKTQIRKPTNPWDMEFMIPWFGQTYSRKYLSAFRKYIPQRDSIQTTGNKRIKIYK